MGLKAQYKAPKIKILYNDKDKTHLFGWQKIVITDFESKEADRLNITLSWQNVKPRINDSIKIYADELFLGLFYISAIKFDYLKSFEIEAISANFNAGLKTKKNRTFENKSYEEIIKIIAKEHSLGVKIDFARKYEIKNHQQFDLSDLAFLQKIADELSLSFCVKNGNLIFIDRDKQKDRLTYKLDQSEIIELKYERISTPSAGSVIVTYHDLASGEYKQVRHGQGEPVIRVNSFVQNANDALTLAKSKLSTQQNATFKGSLITHGKGWFAGAKLEIKLKDETLNCIIKKLTHTIDKNWIINAELF